MKKNPSISVIIPAKNEEKGLSTLLPKLKKLYPQYEIIVVDDGSSDRTGSIILENDVVLLQHKYSMGNGAAIKSGARAAKSEFLVFMDADGQHDPKDVKRLLEELESGYDMVVGARQAGSQANLGRGIANGLYNFLASYMTGHSVEDLTSGFRAVNAEKFRKFIYLLPNGFSYPTTSTMAFFRAGYSVQYLPIHTAKRIGKSHIRLFKDGARFLLIIFKVGTLYSPLKLFAPASAGLLLLGLGWYAYTFFAMNRFTNMSALFMTGSFVVFMMGLISEQITALMYKDDGND